MTKLLLLMAASVLLAYFSQQYTEHCKATGRPYRKRDDRAYLLLIIVLVLFAGLRTSYNDTYVYMNSFPKAPVLSDLLSSPQSLEIFGNPLFYFYQSVLRTFTDDPQILIFTSSAFTQICFIRFFKKYSDNFTFCIFIYIALGTFVFTLAAIKQVMAMATLTLAFPYLQKKKWVKYYLIVFIAMLLHTYALAFAMLPFFQTRPWRTTTFTFIAIVVIIMLDFRDALALFLEQADEAGKKIASYEVFDDATINVFRLAVYAVPPLISLVFGKWAMRGNSKAENTLIHMSIISLAFMVMGTQSGANMFGRMGNYFELGTICCLPQMLQKTFQKNTYRLVVSIACICFMGFFVYANAFKIDFDQHYRAISLWEFLFS